MFSRETTLKLVADQHYVLSYDFNTAPNFTFERTNFEDGESPRCEQKLPNKQRQLSRRGTQHFKMENTCKVTVGLKWVDRIGQMNVEWRRGVMSLFRAGG